jgi:hypothetical protein
METKEEVQVLQITETDVVFQQDKALIDTQIATAKRFPRNILNATNNAVALVTMDKDTAATCTYSVPRAGKAVTGPSVHLAKILAQNWGNLRAEAKVIDIGPRQITSQAVCFDLETNLAIKVEVKRSIIGNKGRYNDDLISVTGNAANSIALRNAILAVIPRSVVDKVHRAAISTMIGDISTEQKLTAQRKQVVDGLKDTYKVTEEEILSAVGKSAVQHLTPEDLVTLIGIGTAIKDGETNPDSAFRGKKEQKNEISTQTLQKLLDDRVGELNKKDFEDAKRIIDNNETASFKKLHDKLIAIKLPA